MWGSEARLRRPLKLGPLMAGHKPQRHISRGPPQSSIRSLSVITSGLSFGQYTLTQQQWVTDDRDGLITGIETPETTALATTDLATVIVTGIADHTARAHAIETDVARDHQDVTTDGQLLEEIAIMCIDHDMETAM